MRSLLIAVLQGLLWRLQGRRYRSRVYPLPTVYLADRALGYGPHLHGPVDRPAAHITNVRWPINS